MFRKTFEKFLRVPIRLYRRQIAISRLAQIRSHNNTQVKAIGNALYECLTNTISNEEQKLICSIEQRRDFLLSSDKKISVIDYGAGGSGDNRTKDEMKMGVQSTLLVSDICAASKPKFWATLLFKLVIKLKPSSCVELGSCVGISASYQAAALKINGKGNLLTLEGSPEIATIARETLEGMKLKNASVVFGPFHKTLKDVLASAAPVDFFFNDGHHDHDAVIEYFNNSLPYISNNAIIIFDDISWSPGMKKAWTEIEEHERVATSIDLMNIGIAIITNKAGVKEKFRIPLF